jgi:hypothetical protein
LSSRPSSSPFDLPPCQPLQALQQLLLFALEHCIVSGHSLKLIDLSLDAAPRARPVCMQEGGGGESEGGVCVCEGG